MRPKKRRDRQLANAAPARATPTVASGKSAAASASQPSAGYRLETPLICLVLVFGAVVAFGGGCTSDYQFFNFDDDEYITQNPHVQAGLTADSIRWAFTTFHSNNWHPLTWLSLELDYMLYGLDPRGYHLTNLLLHAANAVLLFLFLRHVTGAIWRSAMVAGLFLLHPQRVESVVWAAERKDVLSTLFWMLTMWAYVWWVQKPQLSRYLLIMVSLALGLMAKQMLVTLPCVLLLLDYWPLNRTSAHDANRKNPSMLSRWRPLVAEKLPLFALVLAASVIAYHAQEGYRQPLSEISMSARILNALAAYGQYLVKMVWPADLCVLYLHPGNKLPVWKGVAAAVGLAAISWLVLQPRARRWPYLAVGWLWFLGTLVPVIGIVQVGIQAYADRYTYIPLIGIYLLVVWGVADLAVRYRWRVAALAGVSVVVLLVCLVLSWQQMQYWQNPLTMWQHTLEIEPDSYMAQGNVGQLIGDLDPQRQDPELNAKAVEHFRRAIELEPTYDLAYLNLGIVLQRMQRWDEAAKVLETATRLDPDSPRASRAHNRLGLAELMHGNLAAAANHFLTTVRLAPDFAEGHNNLGAALLFQGKLDESKQQLQKALALSPDFADAHNKLGLLLALQGQWKDAESEFRQSLRLSPKDANAHYYLAWSLGAQGQTDAARAEYAAARDLAPDWPKATARLAWFLATRPDAADRNGPLALQQAQIANEAALQPDAELLDALAAALAETGKFPDAVIAAKKAVQLSEPEQKPARETRLQAYEKGQPFRETRPSP